jgi:hypothetical protein
VAVQRRFTQLEEELQNDIIERTAMIVLNSARKPLKIKMHEEGLIFDIQLLLHEGTGNPTLVFKRLSSPLSLVLQSRIPGLWAGAFFSSRSVHRLPQVRTGLSARCEQRYGRESSF